MTNFPEQFKYRREITGEEKEQMFPHCEAIEAILPTLNLTGTVHAYECWNGNFALVIRADGHDEHMEFLAELWEKAGKIATEQWNAEHEDNDDED